VKSFFFSALLFFSVSLRAQAPAPVPVKDEPSHHLVLENSYVRAFHVEIPAHGATLLHQHDLPYVYVVLGPADFTNAVAGKPEAHVILPDGHVSFSPGHFAHIARTDSGIPFRNLTIELLRPQGAPHNLCERIVEGPLGPCDSSPESPASGPGSQGFSLVPLFETDEVRVESLRLELHAKFAGSARFDRLLLVAGQSESEIASSGKPSATLHAADVLWLPAGSPQTFTNSGSAPATLIFLSFKDSGSPGHP
jgi:hypothetical protein